MEGCHFISRKNELLIFGNMEYIVIFIKCHEDNNKAGFLFTFCIILIRLSFQWEKFWHLSLYNATLWNNFENYVLKMMIFSYSFSLISSKDNNRKGFFCFYVIFEGRHFLSRRLDKMLDPETNFRISY